MSATLPILALVLVLALVEALVRLLHRPTHPEPLEWDARQRRISQALRAWR